MESVERIRKRIVGLLNKSTDEGCTPEEAASAAALAAKLMAQHRLTRHDLDRGAPGTKPTVEMGSLFWAPETATVPIWGYVLANLILQVVGTIGIAKQTRFGRKGLLLYGPQQDVEAGAGLLDSFYRLIDQDARARYGNAHRKDGRNYAIGFVTGLSDSIHQAQQDPEVSAALVLYKEDRAAATAWIQAETGQAIHKSGSGSYRYNPGEAFSTGVEEGKRHSIHRSKKVQ